MAAHALFEGLVVDGYGRPVEVAHIAGEAYYVVDDDGFLRHVESEYVDRQVLREMKRMVEGHEEIISQGAMKMLGQEDIFTKAAIEASLEKMDEHFDLVIQQGMPEDARLALGMMGFRVVIDLHGEVQQVVQPGMDGPTEE